MLWILKILLNNLLIVFFIELPLAYLLGARNLTKMVSVALANVITNPVVVFLVLSMTMFFPQGETTVLIFSEISVLFIEALIFKKYKIFERIDAILVSFILNSGSFLFGEFIEFLSIGE